MKILGQCFVLLLLLCGCEKYYLSVKREVVSRERLASTYVGSPDPRQKNPPKGQELIMEWRLPEEALEEKLILVLDLIYKDYTKGEICHPIDRKRGIFTYSLLNQEFKEKEGFLTYKAEIRNAQGGVLKQWKQQLWTELIVIE